MNTDPKVTIVVPTYNAEKYIRKCLDSLTTQTFKDIEIWVVDDGSKDNSEFIASEYALKDKRIKLIQKQNGGYGSVLTYATRNIKTEYFMICDPDDWLAPTAVEELYTLAKKDNLDIAIADRFHVFNQENGREEYWSFLDSKRIYEETGHIYEGEQAQTLAFGCVSPHSKLYRTAITRNIEFPEKISYTDFILYMISLSQATRVEHLAKPLSYYLIDREGNTYTDKTLKSFKDNISVWESTFFQLSTRGGREKPILYYRLYMQFLNHIFSNFVNLDSALRKECEKDLSRIIFKLRSKSELIRQVENEPPEFKNLFETFMNSKQYEDYKGKLL